MKLSTMLKVLVLSLLVTAPARAAHDRYAPVVVAQPVATTCGTQPVVLSQVPVGTVVVVPGFGPVTLTQPVIVTQPVSMTRPAHRHHHRRRHNPYWWR